MTVIGGALLLAGGSLLVLNVAGLWSARGRGWFAWQRQLPAVPDVGAEAYCRRLCAALGERFQHGAGCYGPTGNWAAWLAGRLRPAWSEIQLTDQLFRFAPCGLCSQLAQAMLDTVRRQGLPARLASLGGHVIVEVGYRDEFRDGWHAFDPDYGVSYGPGGGVRSLDEVAAAPELAAAIYRHHRLDRTADEVLAILAAGRRHYLPEGRRLSPRVAAGQRLLQGAKWGVPVLLIAAGTALLRGAT